MDICDLAARNAVSASYGTRVVRLAFLAPAVVEAVLDERQGAGATIDALTLGEGIDPGWREQAIQMLRCAS